MSNKTSKDRRERERRQKVYLLMLPIVGHHKALRIRESMARQWRFKKYHLHNKGTL